MIDLSKKLSVSENKEIVKEAFENLKHDKVSKILLFNENTLIAIIRKEALLNYELFFELEEITLRIKRGVKIKKCICTLYANYFIVDNEF